VGRRGEGRGGSATPVFVASAGKHYYTYWRVMLVRTPNHLELASSSFCGWDGMVPRPTKPYIFLGQYMRTSFGWERKGR